MEGSKLLTLIVTVTVGIIFIGALLGPVINDVSTTEKTFTNEGYYRVNEIKSTDTETYTLSWSVSEPGVITVNDVDSEISSWGAEVNQSFSIFATETDIFRIGIGVGDVLSWVQIRGGTYFYAAASSSFTATIGSGSVSVLLDSDATPKELTYSTAYIIDPTNTAEYTMKKSNVAAYIKDDSLVYGMGITGVNASSYVMKVTGTVDTMDVDVIPVTNDAPDLTISDLNVVSSAVSKYIGLQSFDKVTFNATPEGSSTPTACTYSYVIVPYQVTAELSQHLDAGEIALLAVLPLLAITTLLLLAVRFFTGRD